MMNRVILGMVLVVLGCVGFGEAAPNQTRDEKVIGDRDDLQNDQSWIYNDLNAAKEAARLSGKPMLVVFRCIP